MPRALVLGQGTGTPAVATRVGGIPEIVTRDTGALVPMSSSRVADELVRLVRDPERRRRQGEAARARFLERFEAGVWVEQLTRSTAARSGWPTRPPRSSWTPRSRPGRDRSAGAVLRAGQRRSGASALPHARRRERR